MVFPNYLKTGLFPIILSIGSMAALSFTGCTSVANPPAVSEQFDQSSEQSGKSDVALQVVTTFLPMTYFTKAVAGDRATVTQLLPLNVDPHDYQAKPNDIQRLADADVLVENGLGLEDFLDSLIDNAANPDLAIVDASEGIPVILRDDADHEADESSHALGESDHDHGDDDPHLWLDPKKAIEQVENIRDGLIAADPEGEAIYAANAADYTADLKALDLEISEKLAPYAGKAFVTYHDFAEYFARSYGLEVEHLVNIPEGNPAPADVQRVIDTAKASDLKVLLTESAQPGNAFGAIAADLGINVSLFDPMESTGELNPEPADYLTRMSQNSDSLAIAFGGARP
ncbi:MAG: zinc ABC transporter substrate-binding protein [Phormidesmis sp.]